MPSMCAYDVNSILCSNSIARKQEGYSAAAITRELQKTFGTLSYKRVLTIIKAYKQQKAEYYSLNASKVLELFKRIGCFTQIQLLEGDQLPSTHSMFTYGQGYHVEEDRFVCGTAKRVYSLFIIHLDLYTANFSSGSNGFRTLIAVY
uniref:HTH_48 domain-containing protein n=1 Tax=Heterorhabditis bacteriophora TaxID=37862 RepID=A0A1I7X0I0_HETBA